jgi:hypothetical protein
MANVIVLKKSGTVSQVPSTLESGELALNYADGKLFYKNTSNSIIASRLITNIVGTANQITVSEANGTYTVSLPSSITLSTANLTSLFVDSIEIDTTGATNGQVLKYNGTKFAPAEDLNSGGGGAAGSTYLATIGDGTNTVYALTHNLGTRDILVSVRNANSPYETYLVQWEATTSNTVTLDFQNAPSSNSVRVAVYAAIPADSVLENQDLSILYWMDTI